MLLLLLFVVVQVFQGDGDTYTRHEQSKGSSERESHAASKN